MPETSETPASRNVNITVWLTISDPCANGSREALRDHRGIAPRAPPELPYLPLTTNEHSACLRGDRSCSGAAFLNGDSQSRCPRGGCGRQEG